MNFYPVNLCLSTKDYKSAPRNSGQNLEVTPLPGYIQGSSCRKFLQFNQFLMCKTGIGLYNFRKETHGRRYSTYVQ